MNDGLVKGRARIGQVSLTMRGRSLSFAFAAYSITRGILSFAHGGHGPPNAARAPDPERSSGAAWIRADDTPGASEGALPFRRVASIPHPAGPN